MSELTYRILNEMGLSGITPTMLTEYVPLAKDTVDQWKEGLGEDPSPSELEKIAECLRIPLAQLLNNGDREELPPRRFKSWITRFRHVGLPIGTLSKDILSYRDFPDDDDYVEMLNYLARKKSHNPDVIEAFRTAWDFYVSTKR